MALLEERKRRLAAEGLFEAGAQAAPAVHAARHRRRHLADRRRHPRHHPPHQGPLPAARPGLAGARAGRDRGRGGDARPCIGFNALAADGRHPAPGCADRGARRRQPRGSVGLQRRGAGPRRRRLCHPGHLGGRPRDRLDADRPRRRHARADADRRRRDGRAGQGRARGDAGVAGGAAQRRPSRGRRPQAPGAARGRPRRCPRPTSCWRCRAAASTRRPAGWRVRWRCRPGEAGAARGDAARPFPARPPASTRRASTSTVPPSSCRNARAPI